MFLRRILKIVRAAYDLKCEFRYFVSYLRTIYLHDDYSQIRVTTTLCRQFIISGYISLPSVTIRTWNPTSIFQSVRAAYTGRVANTSNWAVSGVNGRSDTNAPRLSRTLPGVCRAAGGILIGQSRPQDSRTTSRIFIGITPRFSYLTDCSKWTILGHKVDQTCFFTQWYNIQVQLTKSTSFENSAVRAAYTFGVNSTKFAHLPPPTDESRQLPPIHTFRTHPAPLISSLTMPCLHAIVDPAPK